MAQKKTSAKKKPTKDEEIKAMRRGLEKIEYIVELLIRLEDEKAKKVAGPICAKCGCQNHAQVMSVYGRVVTICHAHFTQLMNLPEMLVFDRDHDMASYKRDLAFEAAKMAATPVINDLSGVHGANEAFHELESTISNFVQSWMAQA